MLNTARQKRVAALTLKEQTHTTVLFHDIFRETDVSHRSGEAPYSMVYCKSFAVAESQWIRTLKTFLGLQFSSVKTCLATSSC